MPRKLAEITARGSRREALEALRQRIAEEIDAGPAPTALAALALRLERVLGELDDLPAPAGEVEERRDELRDRRASRAAEAGGGS